MYNILKTRIAQGHRTVKYPKEAPSLPDRFRGLPAIDPSACAGECIDCIGVVPGAGHREEWMRRDQSRSRQMHLLRGCETVCLRKAIMFTGEYRMAARRPARPRDQR